MAQVQEQAATIDQLKALAHPLRWRILRLCRDAPLTNQELAERLEVAPPTMLRHVRTLVAEGFLAPQNVRTGQRGAMERPYRATGITLTLSFDDDKEAAARVDLALLTAHRAEVIEAGPHASRDRARGVMRLGPASQYELKRRLSELLAEFGRRDDPDAEHLSYFWQLIRHPSESTDAP